MRGGEQHYSYFIPYLVIYFLSSHNNIVAVVLCIDKQTVLRNVSYRLHNKKDNYFPYLELI